MLYAVAPFGSNKRALELLAKRESHGSGARDDPRERQAPDLWGREPKQTLPDVRTGNDNEEKGSEKERVTTTTKKSSSLSPRGPLRLEGVRDLPYKVGA